MKLTLRFLSAGMAIVVEAVAVAAEPAEIEARAGAVRATAAEMRFTQIPWVTDVEEGFRLAAAERRPVFLYLITGDALEDC